MRLYSRPFAPSPWTTAGEALLLTPRLLAASWHEFVLTGFVAAVLGVGTSFLVHERYTASASFVPVTTGTSRLPASLSGIAAQLGASASSGSGIPPSVFRDLLETSNVRRQVVQATYTLPGCTGTRSPRGTLTQAYGYDDEPPRRALDDAVRLLGSSTAISYDAVSQLVRLKTVSCSPDLAAAILAEYLSAVERFSLQTLRSQARSARESAERRTQDLAVELSTAEDALTRFYQQNRSYEASPVLLQQETRLKRLVSILESTYLSVRAEYERARLDEARELPAITVVEPPVPPGRKSWPVRWVVGLMAAALACASLLVIRLSALHRPQ